MTAAFSATPAPACNHGALESEMSHKRQANLSKVEEQQQQVPSLGLYVLVFPPRLVFTSLTLQLSLKQSKVDFRMKSIASLQVCVEKLPQGARRTELEEKIGNEMMKMMDFVFDDSLF
jgi:hypothetical protein